MFRDIFQPMHLLLVLGIVLACFRPSKLLELAAGLGKAVRGFTKVNADKNAPEVESQTIQSEQIATEKKSSDLPAL